RLIPVSILQNRIVRCAIVANSFGWGAIIGLNIFLPMYLQGVVGLSPTQAGSSLVAFMLAMNACAGLAGQVLGRVRHYKLLPLLGLLFSLGEALDLAWYGGLRGSDDGGWVGAQRDPDRPRIRTAPFAHRRRHAERGAAPPARHLGRDHEFQPQPLRHDPDRGVRRDRARRYRRVAQRRGC